MCDDETATLKLLLYLDNVAATLKLLLYWDDVAAHFLMDDVKVDTVDVCARRRHQGLVLAMPTAGERDDSGLRCVCV